MSYLLLFFITLGLELSDTKVYEPLIRALLGTYHISQEGSLLRAANRRGIHHPGDNIRANGTSQKWNPLRMPPESGHIPGRVHFWEVSFALMLSPGWT